MKIHFTKKEFRLLIDMISIAEWVMNSHKTGENPKSEPYEKLDQKFCHMPKILGLTILSFMTSKWENIIQHGNTKMRGRIAHL
jgi:hypothetical protein